MFSSKYWNKRPKKNILKVKTQLPKKTTAMPVTKSISNLSTRRVFKSSTNLCRAENKQGKLHYMQNTNMQYSNVCYI
jgi:hypothetical protein